MGCGSEGDEWTTLCSGGSLDSRWVCHHLVAAFLLFFRALREKGRVRGGGLVMIGPFPVIFGMDKESVRVPLLLSIALGVLVLILSMLAREFW